MNADRHRMQKDARILSEYMSTPMFIATEIGASFLVGYFIARKRTLLEAIGRAANLSYTIYSLQPKIQLLKKLK